MKGIKELGLIICLMMVLMAYLKQSIPQGKTAQLMRGIISVFILLSVIQGVRSFDFQTVRYFAENQNNGEVWERTAQQVEKGLQEEFNAFLKEQSVYAAVQLVSVDTSNETFAINRVVLCGKDGETAKKILSARYGIGSQCIEVMNE